MSKVINIVGKHSNVGKTELIEGLIEVLGRRGYSVATIKHDVHGFEIDHEGKDTYRHYQAGAETVIISSKYKMAMIKDVTKELELERLIRLASDREIILVEGYKQSCLRKIEIMHREDLTYPRTPSEQLIALVCEQPSMYSFKGIEIVQSKNYEQLADLIECEEAYNLDIEKGGECDDDQYNAR